MSLGLWVYDIWRADLHQILNVALSLGELHSIHTFSSVPILTKLRQPDNIKELKETNQWRKAPRLNIAENPSWVRLKSSWMAVVFIRIGFPCICLWAAFGLGLRRFLSNPRALRMFNMTMAALLILSLYPLVAHLLA